jgi:hypothetical protein
MNRLLIDTITGLLFITGFLLAVTGPIIGLWIMSGEREGVVLGHWVWAISGILIDCALLGREYRKYIKEQKDEQ